MRIVLVGTGTTPIPPPGYGGVERTIAEYAHALGTAGQDVRIVNETYRQVPRDRFRFAARLHRLLKGLSADIVHANSGVPATRLGFMRIPYVMTPHNRYWIDGGQFPHNWHNWFDREAVRRASATIALTETVREAVIRRAGPHLRGPITTVPIGVDLDAFPSTGAPGDGRRAFGAGLVAPVKRWELAARALVGTGIRLRIAGPIVDRAYADEVESSGPVDLLGEIPQAQLLTEFQQAGFIVHPSDSELLPGVVLQAYSCGRPVIGGAAIRSVVRDGVTGFAPDRPWESADAGVAYLRERSVLVSGTEGRREEMGRSARLAAETTYAWPRVVEAHLQVYRDVEARMGPAL